MHGWVARKNGNFSSKMVSFQELKEKSLACVELLLQNRLCVQDFNFEIVCRMAPAATSYNWQFVRMTCKDLQKTLYRTIYNLLFYHRSPQDLLHRHEPILCLMSSSRLDGRCSSVLALRFTDQ
jgi:hypothetical protein